VNVDVISCRHFYVEFWMSFIFALNELPSEVVVQLDVLFFVPNFMHFKALPGTCF